MGQNCDSNHKILWRDFFNPIAEDATHKIRLKSTNTASNPVGMAGTIPRFFEFGTEYREIFSLS